MSVLSAHELRATATLDTLNIFSGDRRTITKIARSDRYHARSRNEHPGLQPVQGLTTLSHRTGINEVPRLRTFWASHAWSQKVLLVGHLMNRRTPATRHGRWQI
jgi:hypothetical protein